MNETIGQRPALVPVWQSYLHSTIWYFARNHRYAEYLPIDEDHPKDPTNYYGFTKLEIERILAWYDKLKGLRYAALRYFNAAGYDTRGRISGLEKNPANLIPVIMETAVGKRPDIKVFGTDYQTKDGTGVRDYVHVSDLARGHVLALIGPNCMGVLSSSSRLNAIGFVTLRPPSGPLSVISQSGNIGTQLLMSAERRGVGVEKFVSSGNQATTDANDLLDYLALLTAQGLSARSQARTLVAQRQFFKFMRRERMCDSNPTEEIDLPHFGRKLPSFLSLDEVDRLLAAPGRSTPRGLRDSAMLETLYAAGLRVSELVKLRLGDFNLDAGYLVAFGKGKKQRIVPLGEAAVAILHSYLEAARPEFAPAGILAAFRRDCFLMRHI